MHINMPLEGTLDQSQEWMNSCVAIVNTLTVPTTNRSRVAAALHQLSIEHYTGLHVLVENGVYSAALALYRPQFEAYLRGAWYHRCATDNQINDLIAGGEPPSPKEQMVALENCGAFDVGSLQNLKQIAWKNLCDFTHGGSIQVKARAARVGTIVLDIKSEHVASILTASASTALLACVGLAAIAENNQVALKLNEAFHYIYPNAA
ncbi:MAG: hypothetical protein KF771_08545 [Burkholderiales bacterium]|nr:hypothetical protein [Burkholderiales bacterium]